MFEYYKSKTCLFRFPKNPAGARAAIKMRLRLSSPTLQKIGSGSGAASKLAAPDGSSFF